MTDKYDDIMLRAEGVLPEETVDIASLPDLSEPDPFDGYTYMSPPGLWICNDCESFVASPVDHTDWHRRLDARFTDRYDSHVDGESDAADHTEDATGPE